MPVILDQIFSYDIISIPLFIKNKKIGCYIITISVWTVKQLKNLVRTLNDYFPELVKTILRTLNLKLSHLCVVFSHHGDV